MSLTIDRLEAFRRAFVARGASGAWGRATRPPCVVDAVVELGELDLHAAEELARLAPFGAANAEPIFALPRRHRRVDAPGGAGAPAAHARATGARPATPSPSAWPIAIPAGRVRRPGRHRRARHLPRQPPHAPQGQASLPQARELKFGNTPRGVMSIDEPAPGSGSRGERAPGTRRRAGAARASGPICRWSRWRNFRRVLFLILALLAVVALKKSGGRFFGRVLESVAPPAPRPRRARSTAPATTVHLPPGPPAEMTSVGGPVVWAIFGVVVIADARARSRHLPPQGRTSFASARRRSGR